MSPEQLKKFRTYKLLFRPNGNFRVVWDLVIMILATWNCFLIPVSIAFEPDFVNHIVVFIFNSFIDLCFLLDIFFNLRTSFLHPRSGEEIIEPHWIAWEYFRTRWLFIDTLATLPFDTFGGQFLSDQNSYLLQSFGILKLIWVLRLGKIISYLRVVTSVKTSLWLAKLIFFLVLYIHCCGCTWFFIVKQNEEWMPPLDYVWVKTHIYAESKFF